MHKTLRNKKHFLKYTRIRKLVKEEVWLLDERTKELLKEDRGMTEKVNDFFVSIFTVENAKNNCCFGDGCQQNWVLLR